MRDRPPEEWRPIPSAPGWMASSEGRICHPRAKIKFGYRAHFTIEVEPTFGRLDPRSGRFRASVGNRTRHIAPLICEAFHGRRPSRRHVCMHLDEVKTHNWQSNLAWGTQKDNANAPGFLAYRSKQTKLMWSSNREKFLKARGIRPVMCEDGRTFETISEAAKTTGLRLQSIWNVCNGRCKALYGQRWWYL